jgi:hypothetical protein
MANRKIGASHIADLAEKYLAPHQPAVYQILIDRRGIRVDSDGWWEIPIRPSKPDAPTYDWIGRSAEAAVELDDAEGLHVLFV